MKARLCIIGLIGSMTALCGCEMTALDNSETGSHNTTTVNVTTNVTAEGEVEVVKTYTVREVLLP